MKTVGWMAGALIAVLLLSLLAFAQGKGWQGEVIGPHWSPGVEGVFEAHRKAGRTGGVAAADYVAAGGMVKIGPMGHDHVVVLHFPASGALQVTHVFVVGNRATVGKSFDLVKGLGVRRGGHDALSDKLAVEWQRTGEDQGEFWWIDPWTWELDRCQLSGANDAPVVSHSRPPWPKPNSDALCLTSTQVDICSKAGRSVIDIVRAVREGTNGRTSLYEFDSGTDRWESQTIWPKLLAVPRLLMGEGGTWRVFCNAPSPSSIEGIGELDSGSNRLTSRVEMANYVGNYAVLSDAAGKAYIIYQDFALTGGAALSCTYEGDHGWQTDVIDKVGKPQAGDRPVWPDMRLAACVGPGNIIHVSYFDYAAHVVKCATNAPGRWVNSVVAHAEAVSATSVAVQGSRVLVAYGDVQKRAVFLAVADESGAEAGGSGE